MTNIPLTVKNQTEAAGPQGRAEAGGELELADIHDFASKLAQPDAIEALKQYVRWQVGRRHTMDAAVLGDVEAPAPDFAPISINLDLTTACNFACDHCVDMDILNTGRQYDHDKLIDSLRIMASKGMRSVIVIGGGEPTLYPKFTQTIREMKSLGLQVAIVSNGTGNLKIADVANCMDGDDWVRLSLDSGTDATFQKMHKPRKPITLEAICARVPDIRAANPQLTVGFSYIVTWQGAFVNDTDIVENLHEMTQATRLARDSQFSYIAFKPFLTRDDLYNAEVIGVDDRQGRMKDVAAQIQAQLDEARTLSTDAFRVIETTGLKAMLQGKRQTLARQPRECHMQFFRQVLSPLGLYNCPVYRNQPHGRLGDKHANADDAGFAQTRQVTAQSIRDFNATTTCEKVTCLYNDVNWWIEKLIQNPDALEKLEARQCTPDYFL